MAALNLASIKIQRHFRGYVIRKHKHSLQKYQEEKAKMRSFISEKAYTTVQKLRSKFLSSKVHAKYKNEDEAYHHFCASKIAATFRMSLTRKLFKFHRFSIYHIASLQIQQAWKNFVTRHPRKSKEDVAAYKIQMYSFSFTLQQGMEVVCQYENIQILQRSYQLQAQVFLLSYQNFKRQSINTIEVNKSARSRTV
eukprot:TRINITY_DN71734_c0_g1_i1.p2 TRINITY_DN71734_c0_g1~~TRINITY_DN71734_c0_g1_i1.p2  ORF type:complete len:195 (+),score=10.04 TRINITY_DN71734_c0_g1_i1:222-806(+)